MLARPDKLKDKEYINMKNCCKNPNFITCKKEYDFRYMAIPDALFENPEYSGLSVQAKVLYGALLRRTSLSLKNHWVDQLGRVYVFFTRAEAQRLLGCGEKTATKVFKELRDYDLTEEHRQPGKNAANKIFVALPNGTKKDPHAKEKAKAAKKSLAEQRKEFLKKLNAKIKGKQQHLARLEQKIAARQEYLRQQADATVSSATLKAVKARICYDDWKVPGNELGGAEELVDAAVIALAEMETASFTRIENVWVPREQVQSTMKWMGGIVFCDAIQALRKRLDGVHSLKPYLKTFLYNAALAEKASCFTWG